MNGGAVHQVVEEFLRGDISVAQFRDRFLTAVRAATTTRPYTGLEVQLFDALMVWDDAHWTERPAVVDRMRALGAAMISFDPAGDSEDSVV